ncbi:MAG TPA: hypothetical protein VIK99_01265 [Thermaerobacter sp.]
MPLKKIPIAIPEELERAIYSRSDNRSGTICRDLQRLYRLYERALQRVQLTVPEAVFVAKVVMRSEAEDAVYLASTLWAAVLDQAELLKPEGVDAQELADKLKALDDAARLAIIDAVERAGRLDTPIEDAVLKVGLAKESQSKD